MPKEFYPGVDVHACEFIWPWYRYKPLWYRQDQSVHPV